MTTARIVSMVLKAPVALSLLALAGAVPAAADGFDEGQARSRMQSAGYADVQEVHEGNLGEWMARATRDGHPVLIVLHQDGTVALRQDEQVPPAKPVPALPGLNPNKP